MCKVLDPSDKAKIENLSSHKPRLFTPPVVGKVVRQNPEWKTWVLGWSLLQKRPCTHAAYDCAKFLFPPTW